MSFFSLPILFISKIAKESGKHMQADSKQQRADTCRGGAVPCLLSTVYCLLIFMGYTSLYADSGKNRLNYAVSLEARGDLQGALSIYEEGIKKRPKDIGIKIRLANVLYKLGRREDSIKEWNEILKIAPESIHTYSMVAEQYRIRGMAEEAIEVYTKLREKFNMEHEFSLQVGDLWASLGKYDRAVQEYIAYLGKGSNSMVYQIVELKILNLARNRQTVDSVMPVLKEALSTRPDNASHLRLFAVWCVAAAKAREALPFLILKEVKDKQWEEIIYRFASDCERNGFKKEAMQTYSELAKQAPNSKYWSQSQLAAGRIQEELGLYGQAAVSYKELISRYPLTYQSFEALYRVSDLQLNVEKDVEAALSSFHLLSQKSYAGAWKEKALLKVAECLVIQDKIERSKKTYQQIESSTKDASTKEKSLFKLAYLEYLSGNFERALQLLEKISLEYPGGEMVNDALELIVLIEENAGIEEGNLKAFARAELLRLQWKEDGAMEVHQKLIQKHPTSNLADDAFLMVGDIKSDAGDYFSAIETYRKLSLEYPQSRLSEHARVRIGRIFEENLNDTQRAAREYEMFLVDYPDSLLSGEVRIRLRSLRERLKALEGLRKETG